MTETELTFSDNIERLGVTAWLSLIVFPSIASLFHFVFSIEASVIISLFLTIPFAAMLLRIPIKETSHAEVSN